MRLSSRIGEAPQFQWESYDGLPTATALDRQLPSPDPINIRWSENPVEVLERGAEFSRCRHLASGRVLDILTAYLYERGGVTRCEDSTDYCLPVEPGIPSLSCAPPPGLSGQKERRHRLVCRPSGSMKQNCCQRRPLKGGLRFLDRT